MAIWIFFSISPASSKTSFASFSWKYWQIMFLKWDQIRRSKVIADWNGALYHWMPTAEHSLYKYSHIVDWMLNSRLKYVHQIKLCQYFVLLTLLKWSYTQDYVECLPPFQNEIIKKINCVRKICQKFMMQDFGNLTIRFFLSVGCFRKKKNFLTNFIIIISKYCWIFAYDRCVFVPPTKNFELSHSSSALFPSL